MRLLVCGGAGFIGSGFVRRMLAKHADWEIVTFDKLTYAGNRENLTTVAKDPRHTFIRGDICDRRAVEAGVHRRGCVDAIVNFAAETHVDRSIADPESFLRTDILGTHTLLEVVRELEVGKLVQVSTDEVYGSIESGSFCEADRLAPSSPYSASKAGGDLQVLAYHATYGTPACITRGSNTYGSHQYPEKLVPLFVTNALEGKRLPMYGDGLNVRDWLHVDDHCDGVEAAALRGEPGEVYNIGGGNECTNREIASIILDELGLSEDIIERVADRPGHDRRYSIACDKAREALEWEPAVEFEAGLRETIRWYRDNQAWWRPIKHAAGEFAAWEKRWYGSRSA
ncbi:MAG: dTDP-glucose 4,6-dehydratase [Coriobacteriia bacterium]|nr:dTDP-glucose 4,6-dehydratase [Coriobacteriia bacterium]